MRVSAKLGDEGYSAYMARRPLLVFLDGVKVDKAIAADDTEGWVEVMPFDERGRLVCDNDGNYEPERRTGKVQIVPFGHAL